MNAIQSLARAGRALTMAETQNTSAIPRLSFKKLAAFEKNCFFIKHFPLKIV